MVSVLTYGRVSAGVCLKLTQKGVNVTGKIYPIESKLLIIESACARLEKYTSRQRLSGYLEEIRNEGLVQKTSDKKALMLRRL